MNLILKMLMLNQNICILLEEMGENLLLDLKVKLKLY